MKGLKGFVFDAYGTLFDVFSVTALCEQLFPGKGSALAQLWRVKQLQYSMMRSLMGRHRDFWRLTEDGLVYACKSLGLELTADARARLLQAYLSLAVFPDVKPGLEALKRLGLRLAILSSSETSPAPADDSTSRRAGDLAGRLERQRDRGHVRHAADADLLHLASLK
jgi:2-haloacid dehalogenase